MAHVLSLAIMVSEVPQDPGSSSGVSGLQWEATWFNCWALVSCDCLIPVPSHVVFG